MHKTDQQFDYQKFGLKRTLAEDLGQLFQKNRRFSLRADGFEDNIWLYRFLFLSLPALGVAALFSRKADAWAIPLGMVFVFSLLVLSRYYYLAMIVFLIPRREKASGGLATFGAAGVLLIHSLFWLMPPDAKSLRYEIVYGSQQAYTAVNVAFLIFFVVFSCMIWIRMGPGNKKARGE